MSVRWQNKISQALFLLINTHKTMLFSTKYLLENSRDHLKLFNIPDRGKKKKNSNEKNHFETGKKSIFTTLPVSAPPPSRHSLVPREIHLAQDFTLEEKE